LPGSPIRSIKAASLAMWMSSVALSNRNRPASISSLISIRPLLMAFSSACVISFRSASIVACAMDPTMSYL
jgi:hypothetical protein